MTAPGHDWARITAIVAAAVELPADQRAAHVSRACGGDEPMRREVESLLAAHDAAGPFLEMPARFAPVPAAEPLADLAGRSVGSYTIVSRLGAGGMGEIYLARDAKLDRVVALKLLSRELAINPERLRRFHDEARAASALNHPHILVIHDFGELDGRPFLVTEFIEGETLRARIGRGPLAIREAVDLASQVGSALAAAHERGVVHRDIKPENVMLRPDGYAKVLDFGLAKLALRTRPSDDGLDTVPGVLLGTPRYMSPEQARGHMVDGRSDVWSLGVLLYEMISGRPPFAGATAADTIGAILTVEPVPLSLHMPSTPPQLEQALVRALSKNPGGRHQSMADFGADLAAIKRQLDADQPLAAARPAIVARPADFSPSPQAGAVVRRRLIVMPFRLMRPDTEIEFLAFSLADAIATTLSSVDSIVVRSSLLATRFAAEPLDLAAIAATAQVDAVLTGTLLRVGRHLRVNAQLVSAPDGTILWSELIDVSQDDVIGVQDALGERIANSLALPLTPREQELLRRDMPARPRAYELYLRGNSHFYASGGWATARDLFLECVREDPGFAPAWARLGRCYRLTAKFHASTVADIRDNLQRADAAFRKAFALNPDLPMAHHLYTALETDLGRAEDAVLRLVRRARQRRADPELYAGLVHACRYCGLLDASVAAHVRARQLDPQIQTSIAPTYWLLGDYERAIGMTGYFVGSSEAMQGDTAGAIAAARATAATIRDPLTGIDHTILPLLLDGRSEECRRLLDDLVARISDPESVFHIARTYARLGAADAALAQFERTIDMGFVPSAWFARDPWLAPLAAEPRFQGALARAARRHGDAARTFRDAGGERLLGLG